MFNQQFRSYLHRDVSLAFFTKAKNRQSNKRKHSIESLLGLVAFCQSKQITKKCSFFIWFWPHLVNVFPFLVHNLRKNFRFFVCGNANFESNSKIECSKLVHWTSITVSDGLFSLFLFCFICSLVNSSCLSSYVVALFFPRKPTDLKMK